MTVRITADTSFASIREGIFVCLSLDSSFLIYQMKEDHWLSLKTRRPAQALLGNSSSLLNLGMCDGSWVYGWFVVDRRVERVCVCCRVFQVCSEQLCSSSAGSSAASLSSSLHSLRFR